MTPAPPSKAAEPATGLTARRADCYSDGDRGLMEWWSSVRATRLRPFLARLAQLGVSADLITLGALLCGLAFALLLSWSPFAALAALALHVLLDGLDGPLARFRGTAGRRGSFTDTVCDQTVVAASTAALVHAGHLHALPATLYVFVYTIVVIFAMVRNALGVPYRFVVRPRLFVYAWIPIENLLVARLSDLARLDLTDPSNVRDGAWRSTPTRRAVAARWEIPRAKKNEELVLNPSLSPVTHIATDGRRERRPRVNLADCR